MGDFKNGRFLKWEILKMNHSFFFYFAYMLQIKLAFSFCANQKKGDLNEFLEFFKKFRLKTTINLFLISLLCCTQIEWMAATKF
jgi:hypothetical protein